MKTKITYKDLKAMNPCYDPEEIGISENYKASIPNFIKEYRDKVQSKEDILWVLCRNDYMTDRDMRLFAVWCAREALKLDDKPDKRSVNAVNVAEKFANGQATKEELSAASSAAITTDDVTTALTHHERLQVPGHPELQLFPACLAPPGCPPCRGRR